MGGWLLLPQAEEILAARAADWDCIQKGYRRGNSRVTLANLSQIVMYNTWDIANLAEVEGTDFDIINKDLLDYYHDCED